MARRSLLERPDIQKTIRECAQIGLHNHDIARIVGVTDNTITNWYDRGLVDVTSGNRTSKYARLYLLISQNRATHYKEEFTNAKKQSANGNDRATKLLIEMSPDYRHEQRVSVTITQEKLAKLSTADLLALKNGDRTPLALLDAPKVKIEHPD